MATIYVPGGRRSSATTVQTQVPRGTSVSLNPAQATAPAVPSAAQILGVLPTQSGRAGSMGSGNGSIATAGASSISPRQVAGLGTLLGSVGTLTKDSDLSKAGAGIGIASGIANAKNPTDFGMAVAPAVAAKLGVPGGVVGLGVGAAKGDVGMMATGALALANPYLAAVNALAGLFNLPTVGTMVNNALAPSAVPGTGLQAPAQDAGLEGAISSELNSVPAPTSGGSINSGGSYNFGSFGNRSDMGGGTGIGGSSGYGLGLGSSFGSSLGSGIGSGFGSSNAGGDE